MSVEGFVSTKHVELDGLNVGDVVSVHNIGEIFQRDCFPDVHADKDVASANSLSAGGARATHGRDFQTAAISIIEPSNSRRQNFFKLHTEQLPGTLIDNWLVEAARRGIQPHAEFHRFVFADDYDFDFVVQSVSDERPFKVECTMNIDAADFCDHVA